MPQRTFTTWPFRVFGRGSESSILPYRIRIVIVIAACPFLIWGLPAALPAHCRTIREGDRETVDPTFAFFVEHPYHKQILAGFEQFSGNRIEPGCHPPGGDLTTGLTDLDAVEEGFVKVVDSAETQVKLLRRPELRRQLQFEPVPGVAVVFPTYFQDTGTSVRSRFGSDQDDERRREEGADGRCFLKITFFRGFFAIIWQILINFTRFFRELPSQPPRKGSECGGNCSYN